MVGMRGCDIYQIHIGILDHLLVGAIRFPEAPVLCKLLCASQVACSYGILH